MPNQPPSFGSRQYWDARFTSNSNPFEWLEAPTALDPYLVAALKATGEERPEILHIGCGTSLLSYHLRAHIKHPELIHNLDYSEVAIQVGRGREVEIFRAEDRDKESDNVISGNGSTNGTSTAKAMLTDVNAVQKEESEESKSTTQSTSTDPSSTKYMRWSAADLLTPSSLLTVCKPRSYSIIVDKSTSDSIACSEDVPVPLPYPVGASSAEPISSRLSASPEPIHPLHILAIHLALLAKPGARWISLSYSEDRYPFLHPPKPTPSSPETSTTSTPTPSSEEEDEFDGELDEDLDDIPQEVIDNGLPDPGTLWKLENKYEIEVPPQPVPPGSTGNGITHRPKIFHWIYILQRTDVEAFVREH